MSTYIAATLGCLTAMAIAAYAKELRRRWKDPTERLFGKDKPGYYDGDW